MPSGISIKKTDTSHYYSLDVIRIFAALIVLLNHFASYSTDGTVSTMGQDRSYPFLEIFDGIGSVGVEIFFVISGFVIASSASRGSGLSAAANFIYRRGLRIFPILWISSIVSLLALCSVGTDRLPILKSFIRSIVLFPLGPYVDGVIWSLMVEWFFYFLVALTILNYSQNRLEILAKFIAIGSIVYNFFLISYAIELFGFSNESILSSLHRFPYKLFLLRYGVFFALGVFIFSLKYKFNLKIFLIAFVCSIFCVAEIISSSELGPGKTFATICVWGISVAIITAAASLPSKTKIVQSLALQKLLKFGGDLSYPLYLNHYTLGMVLTYHLKFVKDSIIKFGLSFFIIVNVSILVMYLEKYIRRRIIVNINKHEINLLASADRFK